MRTTGHGISAGIGKLGAFIGVFLFPVLQTSFGLRGTLLLTAGVSVLASRSPSCCPNQPDGAWTKSRPASRSTGPVGWPRRPKGFRVRRRVT